MKITDVKVFPVGEDKLKAFVSVIFDDCFMVNDIKVIRGKDGLFISMPSRRKRGGKFKDIAHPLNNDTRHEMERVILSAYEARQEGDEASNEAGEAVSAQPSRERGRGRGGRRSRGRRRRAKREQKPAEAVEAVEASSTQRSEPAAEVPVKAKPEEPRRRPDSTPARAADTKPRELDEAAKPQEPDHSKKSAEEVAEHHLSDSFWET